MRRLIDIVVAAVSFLFFAPVMLVVALAVRLRMGAPVIFRQLRPGLFGRPFNIYKFRTMTDERGADGKPLPDEKRLTPLGKFLRSTSLDELPQLFNLLKGDITVVGPRPLLMEYLPLYTPEQARRHNVKPGVTGWAQVNGRNAISWEERFRMDVWYVDNRSFRLDVRILFLSVISVMKREAIGEGDSVTKPNFTGSKPAAEKGAGLS